MDISTPVTSRWYEARSIQEKLAALLRDGGVYPWGPGQVTRYRDQDMFILGVAMDRFLKSKEGPTGNIWAMLQREVFAPIGIHQAPTNRTIEADGSIGHPLMAYGYYPTISDMVLIARLYQNDGKHGDQQILYAPRIRELLPAQIRGDSDRRDAAGGRDNLYAMRSGSHRTPHRRIAECSILE